MTLHPKSEVPSSCHFNTTVRKVLDSLIRADKFENMKHETPACFDGNLVNNRIWCQISEIIHFSKHYSHTKFLFFLLYCTPHCMILYYI